MDKAMATTFVLIGKRVKATTDILLGAMENGDWELALAATFNLHDLTGRDVDNMDGPSGILPLALIKSCVEERGPEAIIKILAGGTDMAMGRFNEELVRRMPEMGGGEWEGERI